VRTLTDLRGALGGSRRLALARELTKLHEETWRGTLDEALARADVVEPRGEYVVVVEGAAQAAEATDEELAAALARLKADGLTTKDAVAEVATTYAVPKRRVYALATGQSLS
jgi:16S rRNA (cytidine1402-2'-O)-methyltransferase